MLVESHSRVLTYLLNRMFNTSNRASKLGFPASRHAHEFQPLKPQLLEADLHNLFSFIWAHDTYSFDHPRYRLQVAFTLLLIFHLGLHPNVALKEGLYYGDTKVLLTQHKNTIRAILVIRLDNRDENARAA
jgi:hypothetical protein